MSEIKMEQGRSIRNEIKRFCQCVGREQSQDIIGQKLPYIFILLLKEVVGGRMKRKKKLYEVGCYLILKVQENKFT